MGMNILEYFKGEFCVWENIHIDYLNNSILETTLEKCQKYFSIESIWWCDPDEGEFVELLNQDIIDKCLSANCNKDEIHIYFDMGYQSLI
ncbi:hypothetical protein MTR_7g028860 [Medicago truncatula]|uniref:PB1-like domain-containing protein n=1 Tax=Medicago truncatula TaxID=3880 RepID=A0A072TWW6_MEDTR|nr:hypothetical protein MTR_7g028860 [Medicago truncatula]